jgi:large conductance mechanosensitive channel
MKEFKEFAMKGNVIDLAVGVVIGAAFGAIVTSLVADVVMPVLGLLTSGINFSEAHLVLKEANPDAKTPAVLLSYGKFINTLINFVIIAFAIFLVVKAINIAKRKEAAAPPVPAAPTAQEVLLTEIRDLLKQQAR